MLGLRAILSESLGLTLSVHEFAVALQFWLKLGVPVFSGPMGCSCGTHFDDFGDHVLGCSSDPMRIC